MLYMLDTDIASYIIKGGHRRVDHRVAITPPSDLCISAMTRAEPTNNTRHLERIKLPLMLENWTV